MRLCARHVWKRPIDFGFENVVERSKHIYTHISPHSKRNGTFFAGCGRFTALQRGTSKTKRRRISVLLCRVLVYNIRCLAWVFVANPHLNWIRIIEIAIGLSECRLFGDWVEIEAIYI